MTMIETKGPRPYHAGRFTEPKRPADWRTPKYPGDSILYVGLVRGDEMGDVRVQWYGNGLKQEDGDSLKVGSFLPGEVQSSPGDTPKVWPERSEYVTDKETAAKLFLAYVTEAVRNGWRVK